MARIKRTFSNSIHAALISSVSRWVRLAAFSLAVVGVSAASAQDTEYKKQLTGRVEIDGSSTVYPICEALVSSFEKEYPNIKVPVGKSGTGGGFKRFTRGELDISSASRPIKPDEWKACGEHGVGFIEVPIAYDGLTVVINPKNTWVDQLTIAELKKIFGENGASTWAEVRSGWPKSKIEVFSPGTDSGTFDYFKEEVVGKEGAVRSDMTTSEDDNVLVTGVSGSANAIGYFGVAYLEENKDKIKAVPIVNPKSDKAELPTPEAIEGGSYAPFSRPLMLYVSAKAFERVEVVEFINFAIANAPKVTGRVGYVPLPEAIYEMAQSHVDNELKGTHFIGKDGKSLGGTLEERYVEDGRLEP
jgi:phosphate transport system substrate-binding protein